jgi:hypothetical protein
MIGRFIYKKYNKKRTTYVVTDKRILIFKAGVPGEVISKNINQITYLSIFVTKKGIGTIRFDEPSTYNKFYANTGLQAPWLFYSGSVSAFYDIADVKNVYQLINDLRKS